jgi:hypothetical protein
VPEISILGRLIAIDAAKMVEISILSILYPEIFSELRNDRFREAAIQLPT